MQEDRRVCIRSAPSVTLVDVKAITREKVTIAGAWMCEKAVRLKARAGLGLHRLIHLGRSEDEEERQEEVADTMMAATEWRSRKEQEAKERAEWERAMVRARCELRMKTQDKAPELSRSSLLSGAPKLSQITGTPDNNNLQHKEDGRLRTNLG